MIFEHIVSITAAHAWHTLGVRETLKIFRTQPAYALAVILVLSLCMAANGGLFTVVNGLILRPLPFPESDRLMEVSAPGQEEKLDDIQRARSIESAGAFTPWNYPVTASDGIHMAYTLRVTADLIPLLRIQPALGRTLTHAEFGTNVVMLGYDYWRSLGARPDIAGTILTVSNQPYTIVGVLPQDFFLGVRDAKLIIPDLRTDGRTIARLRPGVTAVQAQAEISSLVPGGRAQVLSLARAFYSDDYAPYVLLLATAGFVLLITCANLANLQLVRGLGRQREFAIRAAIGASRARLILQLTQECAPLALAGAACGLFLTRLFHDFILSVLPGNVSRRLIGADALALDWRVIAFISIVGAITVLLFGMLPALSALRFDVMTRLRDAAGGRTRERQRFGQLLVAVEIALALMLLSGAGLAFKSLTRLETHPLGFQPQGVLRAMTDFSATRYPKLEQRAALFAEVERRLGGIPGVKAVGLVAPQVFPFGGPRVRGAHFEIFGSPEREARAEVYAANPAYLESIRLPLLRGRWFTDADTLTSPAVTVLSQVVANRYWSGDECIGRKVRLNSDRPDSIWATVIGVVGDVRNPVSLVWQPTAYRPFAQTPLSGATVMVRAAGGDPLSLRSAIRRELHGVDPTAPEFRIVSTLDDAVRDYYSPQRFTTVLLAIFGLTGLSLAAGGVYAVMRYWVAARTGEIGIRMALGAQRATVLRLVLSRAAVAASLGVAGGLAGAVALRKVMAAQLIGVSATDPVVLSAVAAVLFAAAVVAAWAPARRASNIDPSEALRS
jgi:putative ABC transport system permease protein